MTERDGDIPTGETPQESAPPRRRGLFILVPLAFGVLAGRHQLQVVLESLGAASGDGHLDRQFGLFGLLGELVELATCILGDRQHADFPCPSVHQALV